MGEFAVGALSGSRSVRSIINFILTIICAIAFRTFLFEPFHVPSGSMKSTILEGDYVFVEKFAYGYSRYSFPFHWNLIGGRVLPRQPERGDVVVFVPERAPSAYFIKRVVGLPGDEIQIIDAVLYINGQPMRRSFVDFYDSQEISGDSKRLNRYIETMDNDRSYSVLRDLSTSNLYSDNTPRYVVPADSVFVMGDNRNNSRDSRYLLDVGYIPMERVVGRAAVVAFSWSPFEPWYRGLRLNRFWHSLKAGIVS